VRILIAVHHFPPRYTGGAELRARRTAHYLQSKGHEVAKDPARWEYDNPLVADHLQSFLRDVHPDIFHMFSGYMLTGSALRVASAMRIPTVLTLTDYWFLCPRMHLVRSNGEIPWGGAATISDPCPDSAGVYERLLEAERRRQETHASPSLLPARNPSVC